MEEQNGCGHDHDAELEKPEGWNPYWIMYTNGYLTREEYLSCQQEQRQPQLVAG